MLCYTYDGSFEGLLTAIYVAYYRRENPEKIKAIEKLQQSFLETYVHIDTDYEKSKKVYNSIRDKISQNALDNVYCVYLADREEDNGTAIYEYLKFGWKVGAKVDSYLSDDRVLKVHKIRQRVDLEVHRMMGFVRFSLLEGNIYYAPIEPDNNILPLLAPHFSKRLADQNWIIHDLRRCLAALYNRKEWIIVDLSLERIPEIDAKEQTYRELWKHFYNNVSIKERLNPSLHKRLLPTRYWRHLTEKW
ncbi:MAG: TIGR03915 family putative DNA repair protein [Firmicutes bacterium]|nr:TIGR03915 family putative DNA repair protein [Bacillota bacterium]